MIRTAIFPGFVHLLIAILGLGVLLPLLRVSLLPVRVHGGVGEELHFAEQALIQRFPRVRVGHVFLQRYRVRIHLTAQIANAGRIVQMSSFDVLLQGGQIDRHVIALVTFVLPFASMSAHVFLPVP